ncbi:MAG: class I SAM-dependent methyltransferase [Anaerolineae bacterium]|nr:class I SAM-dependent methyltransferase [Anaerolineae bacterium]
MSNFDLLTLSGQGSDPFGQALWDACQGRPACLVFHRDDGLVTEQDATLYLAGPEAFDPTEAAALAFARGRVLDIGCGAGRHALALQARGHAVMGLDISPLALAVARRRGVCHTIRATITALPFAAASFDTFLLLGNNLGLAGDVEGTVAMLRQLRRLARPGGVLIANCRNPAATDDPVHLAYHAHNRARGRPIGQVTIRVEYGGQVSPWFDLLLLTPAEVATLAERAGWQVKRLLSGARGLFTAILTAE